MIWLKDYKYDGGGWITDASLKSIHKRWCTRGGTPEEIHQRICTTGDATEVMQQWWCSSGDAREVMHQRWCTSWQKLSKTVPFLEYIVLWEDLILIVGKYELWETFILFVGGFNGFYGNGLIVGGFNGFCGKILIMVILLVTWEVVSSFSNMITFCTLKKQWIWMRLSCMIF